MAGTGWHREDRRLHLFARNIGSRYTIIAINGLLSLLVVPFNLQHLGTSAYGLWMLTASITTYFSVLELGYGGAMVKYVAEFRARKDAAALNEIASTTFYLFSALGILCYLLALAIAPALARVLKIDPGQEGTARTLFLIIAANVALHFVFAVFGGIVNGFERSYRNAVPAVLSNVAATLANVAVILMDGGLVTLVAVTTAIRMVPYWHYRHNAYVAFPDLQIRWAHTRRHRLRELTGFSAYLAIIDWSARLTYTGALVIIGAVLSTAAVALYSIGSRLSDAMIKATNQLHTLLFPVIVHKSVQGTSEGQQRLLVRAARLQLALSIAIAGTVAALADVLIPAWVERSDPIEGLQQSIQVLQVLAVVVVLRTWMAMPTTVLKATGHHKAVARASAWTAVASVLLSIALVGPLGIVGAAIGTAVPPAVLAVAVIFPRACRAAGLPIRTGYRRIVLPALWPVVPVVTLLAMTRHALPSHLAMVLVQVAAGGALYLGLFVVGLDRDERRWMWSALLAVRHGRGQALAAA